MDLVPLLQLPAEDPKELQQQQQKQKQQEEGPRHMGGSGGTNTGSVPSAAAPTLLSVLKRLQQQCTVFKRSAQELTDGDEEDVQVGGVGGG
jgi:hypothetical protein